MTDTFRLVYHSANHLTGTPDEVAAAIEQILAASRRNNARVGVTGALMFNGGFFTQVLEGDQGAIEATFERIQLDRRHGQVTLLAFSQVPQRAFANWSMALVGGSASETARFGTIAAESGFDPHVLSGEQLFGRLRDLLAEEGSAAA